MSSSGRTLNHHQKSLRLHRSGAGSIRRHPKTCSFSSSHALRASQSGRIDPSRHQKAGSGCAAHPHQGHRLRLAPDLQAAIVPIAGNCEAGWLRLAPDLQAAIVPSATIASIYSLRLAPDLQAAIVQRVLAGMCYKLRLAPDLQAAIVSS